MTKLVTPIPSGITHNSAVPDLGSSKAIHPASRSQRVPIRHILKDDSLQVRARVEPRVVRQYSEAMQAGAKFPLVMLAHIDGSLYLVDGWHRVAATLANNQSVIWADVSEMTFNEARTLVRCKSEHRAWLTAQG